MTEPALQLKDRGQGEWLIADTMTEELPEDHPLVPGVMIHPGGIAHLKARTLAAAEWIRCYDGTSNVAELLSLLAMGQRPATLLFVDNQAVTAREAKIFRTGDGLAFLPKGARKKGLRLNPDKNQQWPVYAVTGYGWQQQLADRFKAVLANVPATVEFNVDGVAPYHSGAQVQAAYLFTHPGFGEGPVPGCLYFATGYDREDDILDGYLWAPPGELTSENGSSYKHDLERWGGRIPGWIPDAMTLDDCFALPTDMAACYEAIAKYVADPPQAA